MRMPVRVVAVSLVAAAAFFFPHTSAAQTGPVILPGIPVLRQQHNLTCESSAASMATRGQIVEGQLMAVMPRNPNPNLGFRGNPNGLQGTKLIDYGVYAAPLHLALLHYGYSSDVLLYAQDRDIKGYINRGWPVVAWVTYNLQPAKPRFAVSNGVQYFLVPHEHAVTVIGYDNQTVIVNDPWNRTETRYYWWDFNRAWGYFGNMALAVDPCVAPSPVQRITVSSISSNGVTWTWPKAANAAHYAVTVTRYGTSSHVEFNGVQDATQFTVNNPLPGRSYEIDVRSVSACGEQTDPVTLWTQLPSVLSTPTPPASEATTTVPSPTPTLTASPGVATATPAPSAPTPTPTRAP